MGTGWSPSPLRPPRSLPSLSRPGALFTSGSCMCPEEARVWWKVGERVQGGRGEYLGMRQGCVCACCNARSTHMSYISSHSEQEPKSLRVVVVGGAQVPGRSDPSLPDLTSSHLPPHLPLPVPSRDRPSPAPLHLLISQFGPLFPLPPVAT